MPSIIDPVAASQAAARGLGRMDLNNNPDVAAAYAGGHAGAPLLVARLDDPDRAYYLVPWEDQRGVLLIAQIDAVSGEFSSAAALPTPVSQLTMSADAARRLVEMKLHAPVTAQPTLVWQPSHESASPLQPFYRVAIQGAQVFVGVDGTIYQRLTPFGRGG